MNTLERAIPAYREEKSDALVLRNNGDGRLVAVIGDEHGGRPAAPVLSVVRAHSAHLAA